MFLLGLSLHPATFGVRFDSLNKKINAVKGRCSNEVFLSVALWSLEAQEPVFSYLRIEGFGKRE